MQLSDIKQILVNHLTTLEMNKSAAFTTGNLEQYSKISLEIIDTQDSLTQIENIINPIIPPIG